MDLLALGILGVAVADIVRWEIAASRSRIGLAAAAAALVMIGGVRAGTGSWGTSVAFGLPATGVVAAWLYLSGRAVARRTLTAVPLLVLGGGVVALLALSGDMPHLHGELLRGYEHLDVPRLSGASFARSLWGLAALAFLQSSANVVVRLILLSVGAPAEDNERTLKGGRILGPMERTFIFALGVAGDLTAAAIVVAAKGLLRFPEIRATSDSGRQVDTLTEYFLVGSMASWLLALAFLPLLPPA